MKRQKHLHQPKVKLSLYQCVSYHSYIIYYFIELIDNIVLYAT